MNQKSLDKYSKMLPFMVTPKTVREIAAFIGISYKGIPDLFFTIRKHGIKLEGSKSVGDKKARFVLGTPLDKAEDLMGIKREVKPVKPVKPPVKKNIYPSMKHTGAPWIIISSERQGSFMGIENERTLTDRYSVIY